MPWNSNPSDQYLFLSINGDQLLVLINNCWYSHQYPDVWLEKNHVQRRTLINIYVLSLINTSIDQISIPVLISLLIAVLITKIITLREQWKQFWSVYWSQYWVLMKVLIRLLTTLLMKQSWNCWLISTNSVLIVVLLIDYWWPWSVYWVKQCTWRFWSVYWSEN